MGNPRVTRQEPISVPFGLLSALPTPLPDVGAPHWKGLSHRTGRFHQIHTIYTIYERIAPESKKKSFPFSCATLAASIDASLSLVGVDCSSLPYTSFHCFRSRFSWAAASLAFLTTIERFASRGDSTPVWLSGLTCRLVYRRCRGSCVALIRAIVSWVIWSSASLDRWWSKIFVRSRWTFGKKVLRWFIIFAWFFSSASIDFGGVILTLDDERAIGGGDGVSQPRRSGAIRSGITSWLARLSTIMLPSTGQIPRSLNDSRIIRWLKAFSRIGPIMRRNSDFPTGSPAQNDRSLLKLRKCCL